MDWLSGLGDIATSGIGGVAAGIFGTAISGVAKYFQRKQEIVFEQSKWSHEKELLNIERNIQNDNNEHELETMSANLEQLRTQGSYSGLDTSIRAQMGIRSSYMWVDAVRALFRPVLTLVLCWMTMNIFWSLMDAESALSAILTSGEAVKMLMSIVNTVIFTASTGAIWWYGDRTIAPKK